MTKHRRSDEGHNTPPTKKRRVDDTNWPVRPNYSKSVSSGATPSSETTSYLYEMERDKVDVSDPDVVAKFQKDGKKLVEWIDNPSSPGCEVGLSMLTFQEVIWARLKKDRYKVDIGQWSEPPRDISSDLWDLGFSHAEKYRHTWLRRHGIDREGHRRFSEFSNYTINGVIIGDNIWRYHGLNWSDIALAQYKMDFDINALRHIYFVNVVNLQTFPYVREILYEQNCIPYSDKTIPCLWHYGTRRYHEILGTRLGKSAAFLVLGAFQRGTHRIEKIQTWVWDYCLHLRFDIEQITPASPASP